MDDWGATVIIIGDNFFDGLQVVFGTMLVWSEVGFLRIFCIIIIIILYNDIYLYYILLIVFYYIIILFKEPIYFTNIN